MDRLELIVMALIGGPQPPQSPACGPVVRDEEQHTIDVPICDTGILTGTVQAGAIAPAGVLAPQTGYFQFVIRVEPKKVHLPLALR